MQHNHHVTELIVSLDFAKPEKVLAFVEQVRDPSVIFNIGPDLFLNGGPDLVRELVHRKKRVCLDLKLHDTPKIAAHVASQAALLHVEMLTVHLAGGSHMIKAIRDELQEIPSLRPKILGVTVLTTFDDVRWAEVTKALTHHAVEVGASVSSLVEHAATWGVDGLICSALELPDVISRFPGLYTVVPGVLADGALQPDQPRVVTPLVARRLGANAILINQASFVAEAPQEVVGTVLKDLSPSELSA